MKTAISVVLLGICVRKIKHNRNIRIARYVIYRETLLDKKDIFWSFIGSFVGIGLIGFLSSQYFNAYDHLFLIGSFGASAVLIYGATNSPLAQPRNLVGGHLISAIIGVTAHKIFQGEIWLSAALAVSLSIVLMQITKTLHPPGGATALIANIGSEKIISLGYFYVIAPVLAGVIILLIVAMIFNNIPPKRAYPYRKPKNRLLQKLLHRKYN